MREKGEVIASEYREVKSESIHKKRDPRRWDEGQLIFELGGGLRILYQTARKVKPNFFKKTLAKPRENLNSENTYALKNNDIKANLWPALTNDLGFWDGQMWTTMDTNGKTIYDGDTRNVVSNEAEGTRTHNLRIDSPLFRL